VTVFQTPYQWGNSLAWAPNWLVHTVDIALVLGMTYVLLLFISDRRTLWMVRGFIFQLLLTAIVWQLGLRLVGFVMAILSMGASLAISFVLQSEFRRFLEQLGRGEILKLFQPSRVTVSRSRDVIDEIVDAVKELSQNRTGALLILETGEPIDDRDFSVPGVRINAEVSKELIQSIFQTTTLLHDGALLIRASQIYAASVILPISERTAARRLGTRHRAAMGITERVENCVCVVVSEETGSISLAEQGVLNRPLTSSKLKELLEERLSRSADREAVAPDLRGLSRRLGSQGSAWLSRLTHVLKPSALRKKK
jgi:uncharacterized protein (TIGR00159 family)